MADTDKTLRKPLEDKLYKNAEEEINTILRTTIDGFYLVDIEGRILDTNDSYCSMIGYSREELIKMKVKDIEAVDTEDVIKKRIQQILKTGYARFETKHLRKDGRVISVEASINYLIDEKPKLFCFMRDITERKLVEAELVKLQKAIYASGEIVFITDKNGVITFVNPAFTSTYGYAPSEVVGRVTPRILKSGTISADFYQLFWNKLLCGKGSKDEYKNKRKDGTIIDIEGSANTIFDENKNIIGCLGIQRDITERKLLEKKAEEKIREIERFNNLMIGREFRMIELKKEINELRGRLGEKKKYRIVK